MKIFKYKAFTLSELMVLMAILTILFAAFAPVFTRRYSNASSDYVWTFVADDENGNAYTDELNKSLLAQSFIGLSPMKPNDVISKYLPYSKLVIRSSDSLNIPQAQVDFRYGDSDSGNGELVSSLFAGNWNFMLGGPFRSIASDASANTAFGVSALTKLTDGDNNTAVGYQSLTSVTTGSDNTSIGMRAGANLGTGGKNTFIGYHSGQGVTGDNNTLVGNYVMSGSSGSNNTSIGAYTAQRFSGNNNTALGAMSLNNESNKSGNNNTAVGAYTLRNNNGNNNTAIGYNACSAVTGSNKICIGKDSGSSSASLLDSKLFTDSEERVFIGNRPKGAFSDGAAVLEVHNVSGSHSAFMGNTGTLGNASVVVNGNLVVRGQTYMAAESVRGASGISMTSYKLIHPKGYTDSDLFGGYDGHGQSERLSGNHGYTHAKRGGSLGCICAYGVNSTNGIKSYDWTTKATGGSESSGYRYAGAQYIDKSTGATVYIAGSGHNERDNLLDDAHGYYGNSCCPYLTSDARLKNIGTEFTGGLKEINKLKIYNYTYKKDKLKLPHVGVIAQDLKRIFPTAVTKAADGYYRIRWDEIFYSAINAVKELNSKIDTLALRVKKDIERVSVLKKDNAQLKKQLDVLSQELSALEK